MAAGQGSLDRNAINLRVIWVQMDDWVTGSRQRQGECGCCGTVWPMIIIAGEDRHDNGVFSMRDSGFKGSCCVWVCGQRFDLWMSCPFKCCSPTVTSSATFDSMFIISPTLHECPRVRGLFFLSHHFDYRSSFVKMQHTFAVLESPAKQNMSPMNRIHRFYLQGENDIYFNYRGCPTRAKRAPFWTFPQTCCMWHQTIRPEWFEMKWQHTITSGPFPVWQRRLYMSTLRLHVSNFFPSCPLTLDTKTVSESAAEER